MQHAQQRHHIAFGLGETIRSVHHAGQPQANVQFIVSQILLFRFHFSVFRLVVNQSDQASADEELFIDGLLIPAVGEKTPAALRANRAQFGDRFTNGAKSPRGRAKWSIISLDAHAPTPKLH